MYLLRVLLVMGIDDELMRKGVHHVRSRVLSVILEQRMDASAFQAVGLGLFDAIQHPVLRRKLIDSMPDVTLDIRRLKRRLALAFVLDDVLVLAVSLDEPSDIQQRVLEWLNKHTEVSRDGQLDVGKLAPGVSMLDVGIGSGFPVSPVAAGEGQDRAVQSSTFQSDDKVGGGKKSKYSATARKFDAGVDELCSALHRLFTSIADKGLTDIQRTEVKNILERTRWRLQLAARTRAAKKENVMLKSARLGRQLAAIDAGSVSLMSRWAAPTSIAAEDMRPSCVKSSSSSAGG